VRLHLRSGHERLAGTVQVGTEVDVGVDDVGYGVRVARIVQMATEI